MEEWLVRLDAGQPAAAWDLFLAEHRGLITATIRRLVADRDDVMDLFATACAMLSVDDCARLRNYARRPLPRASAQTWLVAVVRNLTIDWLRSRHGRRRVAIPARLSPLQREIFIAICIEQSSPSEAFELLRCRIGLPLAFPGFLREVRETNRAAPCPDQHLRGERVDQLLEHDGAVALADPAETAEATAHVAALLAAQPPDTRLAIELFVLDEVAATQVAEIVGWANAKTVYNRVYRALEAIRAGLDRAGIGRGDL